MNPAQDLERKLRSLQSPALPDPVAKQSLREELRSRAHRSRERARFARGAMLAALATSILVVSQPAITRFDAYQIMRIEAENTTFNTRGNASRSVSVNNLEEYKQLTFMLKQEEFSLLHMAGETRLIRVSGYGFDGATYLGGNYLAQTSVGPHTVGHVLQDDFKPAQETRRSRFLDECYPRCLQEIFSGLVQADGDSLLATLHDEIHMKRYHIPTQDFGMVTIWWGMPDSADAGGF